MGSNKTHNKSLKIAGQKHALLGLRKQRAAL